MNQSISTALWVVGLILLALYMKDFRKINQLKIDPSEAKKRLDQDKGIILLDVRTQEEYFENHIPRSTLIPLNVLAGEADKKLPDKQATIFIYCRSGNRSRAAVKMLLKRGYTQVFNLGGIIRWPYKTVAGKK